MADRAADDDADALHRSGSGRRVAVDDEQAPAPVAPPTGWRCRRRRPCRTSGSPATPVPALPRMVTVASETAPAQSSRRPATSTSSGASRPQATAAGAASPRREPARVRIVRVGLVQKPVQLAQARRREVDDGGGTFGPGRRCRPRGPSGQDDARPGSQRTAWSARQDRDRAVFDAIATQSSVSGARPACRRSGRAGREAVGGADEECRSRRIRGRRQPRRAVRPLAGARRGSPPPPPCRSPSERDPLAPQPLAQPVVVREGAARRGRGRGRSRTDATPGRHRPGRHPRVASLRARKPAMSNRSTNARGRPTSL